MSVRGTPDPLKRRFNSLSAEIEGAGRIRNRLIHDQHFIADDKTIVRFEVTADRSPKYGPVEVTVEDVHALIEKIESLETKMIEFRTDAVAATLSWPREQFLQSPDVADILHNT